MTEEDIIAGIEDDQSAQLCDRYESALVAEAREIAEGRSLKLATDEHLRVLLSWLDGHESITSEAVRNQGWSVTVEAQTNNIAGLVQALMQRQAAVESSSG